MGRWPQVNVEVSFSDFADAAQTGLETEPIVKFRLHLDIHILEVHAADLRRALKHPETHMVNVLEVLEREGSDLHTRPREETERAKAFLIAGFKALKPFDDDSGAM